jgi:hypothetical protein
VAIWPMAFWLFMFSGFGVFANINVLVFFLIYAAINAGNVTLLRLLQNLKAHH